uniref:4Fe-4S ferredoxin-type domain-containing protein n=1 Tax=Anas zonorhyncha TaxID=75864 RepID=A0A8B9UZZ8_9AVES
MTQQGARSLCYSCAVCRSFARSYCTTQPPQSQLCTTSSRAPASQCPRCQLWPWRCRTAGGRQEAGGCWGCGRCPSVCPRASPHRHGQLGHGGLESEQQPRLVEALAGVPMRAVAAGGWHSASISGEGLGAGGGGAGSAGPAAPCGPGQGRCWCPVPSSTRLLPRGLSRALTRAAPCVLAEGGDLYMWGWNESGQLALPSKAVAEEQEQDEDAGTGAAEPPPPREQPGAAFISIQAFPALLDLPQDVEVDAVSCGSRHTAAVTRDGELYTWGWGKYGQLGHGDNTSSDRPRRVEHLVAEGLRAQEVVCGPWNTYVCVLEQ